MSSKVDCSLTIYEAKANGVCPNPDAAAGGIIEIRIRLRYQLCIKAHGVEVLIDDILTPEFITPFAMPLAFLLPEFSVMHVSNMLRSINVDAKVRDFLSLNIANFAVDLAKRHGAAVSGFMTVARVFIKKVDFIRENEFDRISRTLKQEDNGGSKHAQNVKSEEDT